ncbi:Metalloprotease TldD [Candidatus Bealeia paramacronuclearis]|uniref:Metalloprotease TldD n=2 Tax=Candidatus Bealeia paramacronuclearis TaxID=1921001 RepID=A0ABZ2C2X1_9PROT|nr:Metalloprotease TldD [Candidatus Bealeia paramacronuclearis]
MSPFQNPNYFFESFDLDPTQAERLLNQALNGKDDGELFLEHKSSESFSLDDGTLKAASYDSHQGFGLRGVLGEAMSYAHASEISESTLKRACESVQSLGGGGTYDVSPSKTNQKFYTDQNPLSQMSFEAKISFLNELDHYVRAQNPQVRQIRANLRGSWQVVTILRADGFLAHEYRPMVALTILVTVEKNGKIETAYVTRGGRFLYENLLVENAWKPQADEALRKALLNLEARPAPAGEMPVVLGSGIPGVLLHEAVGHGLEGDFNRKGQSTFSASMGKRIAAPGVTVIDSGNVTDLDHAHGNLTVDDEGTPTSRTTLIEDGIMMGHMLDRQNARLMGKTSTGNGRRESYAHPPMPRMTNTFMLPGKHSPDDIISSVKNGIYAAGFNGGQVDIVSGKFVFTTSEAYLIEDGKITSPIKGATLVGSGPEVMQSISMIGNNLSLDPGIGMCGKEGQSVLVGLGQPTLLISKLTVGGTA